jgi:hypothetical protein
MSESGLALYCTDPPSTASAKEGGVHRGISLEMSRTAMHRLACFRRLSSHFAATRASGGMTIIGQWSR